jgi:AcrR family transcriptional regulator
MARTIAKDHDEKRNAILKTAAGFFADTGYDRAAMSQLAVACGISKASIYHYYDSKEALLFGILDHHLTELLKCIQTVDTSSTDTDLNLRSLVQALLKAYRGADSEHRLQLEAMRYLPAEQQKHLADIQRKIVQYFSNAVRAIDPDLFTDRPEDLRPVTMSLFGMLNWFYLWHQPGKGMIREEYADLATNILMGGLIRIKTPSK